MDNQTYTERKTISTSMDSESDSCALPVYLTFFDGTESCKAYNFVVPSEAHRTTTKIMFLMYACKSWTSIVIGLELHCAYSIIFLIPPTPANCVVFPALGPECSRAAPTTTFPPEGDPVPMTSQPWPYARAQTCLGLFPSLSIPWMALRCLSCSKVSDVFGRNNGKWR